MVWTAKNKKGGGNKPLGEEKKEEEEMFRGKKKRKEKPKVSVHKGPKWEGISKERHEKGCRRNGNLSGRKKTLRRERKNKKEGTEIKKRGRGRGRKEGELNQGGNGFGLGSEKEKKISWGGDFRGGEGGAKKCGKRARVTG